jgi:hypothetical protein
VQIPGTGAAVALLIPCILCCNGILLGGAPAVEATAALYQENNLLENLQLLLLLACLVTFATQAVLSNHKPGRHILAAAALLSFTFIVRESDLRPFGLPAAITWFSDGPGRYVLLTPPWLGLLWTMHRHCRAVLRQLRGMLFSAAGAALACSLVLLAAGVLLDKGVIHLPPSRYYEELCELNAYFFMLLGALVSGRRARQTAQAASNPA